MELARLELIIVEDEPVIARRLARLAKEIVPTLGHIELAPDFEAAKAAIDARTGSVVLLDLNLHGRDGFELLRRGLANGWRTIVVSAHTERAIEAFELGVIDFVPKPFSSERLKLALERAAQTGPNERMRYLAAIRGAGTQLVALDDIVAIHGADDYSEIETTSGQRLLHRKSLQTLAAELPKPFFRAHRSHIVNLTYARELERSETGGWSLKLANGTALAVGRQALAALRAQLV
jgi:two-component system response regulator LytT